MARHFVSGARNDIHDVAKILGNLLVGQQIRHRVVASAVQTLPQQNFGHPVESGAPAPGEIRNRRIHKTAAANECREASGFDPGSGAVSLALCGGHSPVPSLRGQSPPSPLIRCPRPLSADRPPNLRLQYVADPHLGQQRPPNARVAGFTEVVAARRPRTR